MSCWSASGDIRASERRVYLRVREILALAADYAPSEPETQAILPDRDPEQAALSAATAEDRAGVD